MLKRMLFLLWLRVSFAHSVLDTVPISVFGQETKNETFCLQKIFSNIGESGINLCGGKTVYGYLTLRAIIRDRDWKKICLTDIPQDVFDQGRERNLNLTGYRIARRRAITNVSDISQCNWLHRGSQKLEKGERFISLVLNNCSKDRLRLIVVASLNETSEQSCLSEFLPAVNNESSSESPSKSPLLTSQTAQRQSDGEDFLQHFKENLIPIFVGVGGVLIITFVGVSIYKCKHKHKPSSEDEVIGSSISLQPDPEGASTVYHEPNVIPNYVNIPGTSARDYAYAYSHFEPARIRNSKTTAEVLGANQHDYMNLDNVPDASTDDQQDYVDMNEGSAYTSLDSSSMVNDNAQYQALLEQRGQDRPKVAPKPNLRKQKQKQEEVSYVKVL